MPWSKDDVDDHKEGLSEKEKDKWVSIANAVLDQCQEDGNSKEDCEGRAIRIANSKAGD